MTWNRIKSEFDMHSKITRLFFILTFFAVTTAFGQKSNLSVEGTVVDTAAAPLAGATVVLLQRADSVLVSFGITNDNGSFLIKRVAPGDYILQVTFVGYSNLSKDLTMAAESINLGPVIMEPASADLAEVLVKSEHIPMAVKKDTLEYNADAFKTQPNAVVEELLKKLPGVEVGRDGSIKAMGKEVENVLVDGKEFFGKDPQVATKNLPANAVDKVQVYDKKSDTAEFTGIDDGKKEKTINLKLKADKKAGAFGSLKGGYGTDNRFNGKLNVNKFSPKSQFSILGMGNNVNEQGFNINDYINFMGGMSKMMSGGGGAMRLQIGSDSDLPLDMMGGQNGISTTLAGGVNWNYDLSKKTEISSSYFYNRIQNEQDKSIFRQNWLENDIFSTDEQRDQTSKNENHRLNLTIKHDLDSMSQINFRSSLSFNDGNSSSLSNTRSFQNSTVPVNQSTQDWRSTGDQVNWNSSLVYRRKFNKKGRAFVADLGLGISRQNRNGNLMAMNSYFSLPSDTIRQRQQTEDNGDNYRVSLAYTEPVGKGKYVEWNLSRQNYNNDYNKNFYDILDENTQSEVLNQQLSNKFRRDYTYDQAGLRFRLNKKKLNVNTSLSVQKSGLGGQLASVESPIKKDFWNLLPGLNADYEISNSKSLKFGYNTNIQPPSLEQLQPIEDNSDPINIYVGNPDLRPQYFHQGSLSFFLFDQFSQVNFFANLDGNYIMNPIVNAQTIDTLLRQRTQPVNLDHSTSWGGYLSFGAPLRWMGSRLSISSDWRNSRSFFLLNGAENQTDQWDAGAELSLENKNKERFDVAAGIRVNYNWTGYKENSSLNQDFTNQVYFADFTYNPTKAWSINTSMDYTVYSQESFGGQQTIAIWKASLSRYLFNNRGQLEIAAFDLLNQNVGISRRSSLNSFYEQTTVSLGRYFMVNFTWALSGFANQQSGGIHMKMIRRR